MRDTVKGWGRAAVSVVVAVVVLAGCTTTPGASRTSEPTPSVPAPSGSPYTTGTKDDVAYGRDDAQTMDLCYPPSPTRTTGAFLLVHGGSWSSGDKGDLKALCRGIAQLGFVAATMNYRMLDSGATYADMLADIDLALATYADTARADGWSVTKVGLLGVSAGAQLSLLYAYTRSPTLPVGFVVGMSSPTDFLDPAFVAASDAAQYATLSRLIGVDVTAGTVEAHRAALEAASPLYRATATSPPTLLCHGEKDTLVPYSNATLLADRLQALGVPHQLLSYPNSGHDLSGDPDVSNQFLNLVLDYANRYLY